MKRLLLLSLVGLVLVGCGNRIEMNANYSVYCVDGVKYLATGNGVTVMYTPQGNISTCSILEK